MYVCYTRVCVAGSASVMSFTCWVARPQRGCVL